MPFEGEHNDDGEEEGDESEGGYGGDKFFVIPIEPFGMNEEEAGEDTRSEGDTEVYDDAPEDINHADGDDLALDAEEGGKPSDEDPGVEAVKEDLGNTVESDKTCGILATAFGEVVPDENHGDTASQANEDKAYHILGVVSQKNEGEGKHDDGAHEPVLNDREGEDTRIGKDFGELAVVHFSKRGIHHEDEANGNGDVGGANSHGSKEGFGVAYQEIANEDPEGHGGKNPEGEVAVQEG